MPAAVAFVAGLIANDELWAAPYRPLIAQYGPAAVFTAGIAVLGYPPTWDARVRFPTLEAVRVRLLNTYG